jgi:mRNA-degrading endonuclease YafQ of YafQ-DinJ toxin-antitoxin module
MTQKDFERVSKKVQDIIDNLREVLRLITQHPLDDSSKEYINRQLTDSFWAVENVLIFLKKGE